MQFSVMQNECMKANQIQSKTITENRRVCTLAAMFPKSVLFKGAYQSCSHAYERLQEQQLSAQCRHIQELRMIVHTGGSTVQ